MSINPTITVAQKVDSSGFRRNLNDYFKSFDWNTCGEFYLPRNC